SPQPLQALGFGAGLSAAAGLVNLLIARLLLRSATAWNSPALEGDGRHLMTDVWTTAGVIAGVGLAGITGIIWLDPLVAIIVALHILYQGGSLLMRSAAGLMDRALDRDLQEQIS